MPSAPEATPLRRIPHIWALAGVTYGLVILFTIATVVAYKHYWPSANVRELALEQKSASITVGDVWVPVYPGAIHQDMTSSTRGDITEGDLRFTSTDSPAKLIAFYRMRLQQAKFNVLFSSTENGGRIQAFANRGKSIATLTFTASGSGCDAWIHTLQKKPAVETKP
jgi:hypothetical protein